MRMVDAKGKPLQGKQPQIQIVLSPGTIMASIMLSGKDDKDLEGDWIIWENFHRGHYTGLKTDADGRVTIPGLIPDAPYQVTSFDAKFDQREGMAKVDCRVPAGKTLKLPDFVHDR